MTAVDRHVQALFDAALEGDTGTIWSLIDADSSLVWETVRDLTALHVAAIAGKNEAVALLIRKRASVNANGVAGTPLFQAALAGYTSTVEILLANGADPDLATAGGQTPLMAAAHGGFAQIGRILISRGANLDVRTASGASELESRTATVGGESALHYAAGGGHLEFVALLLERGANPQAEDNSGLIPLDWALRQGRFAVAELLCKP
jgi:ankyrin repeat protein